MILDKLEKEVSMKRGKDVRIADIFDMVAGTSTGSIISLGLTVSDEAKNPRPKYRASDLVKIYNEDGKKVFGSISRWNWVKVTAMPRADETEQEPAVDTFDSTYFKAHTRIEMPLEGPFEPSYSAQPLEELLSEKFEDKSLKDTVSNVDVLIPAYNITEKREVYFTNDSYDPNSYKISDVIRASTAAPTYFPAKQIDNSYYIDGGVFINNPAFKAYLEAKKKYPQAKKFVVCSLGTGFFQAELNGLIKSGWIYWMSPLISLMMNASTKLTEGYLESLRTEQDFHYYRLQYDLSENIPLDDTRTETLKKLAVFADEITESTEFKNLVEEIVENEKLKDQ
ncbi:3699_t:CDS:1 [Paraglomus brasilianum]|uniref:3699_t:CDS:1 n=1 Tax=Paraglomus brasilianum TaxID=144538 RepID=A0A9N9GSE3_9GLOM|nr:3699_t:CDS:1 [Paraglomus brasilianum]